MPAHFFAEPDFLGLLRFWDDSCAGRSLPDWDGDIACIPAALLPNLVVSERRPEPVYRYVGAECERRWGGVAVGRRVYQDVLMGAHGRYIRSLGDDVIARRAPIFSAAIYRLDDEDLLTTGRLFAPFTYRGSAEPCVILALQLFRGPELKLARLGREGFVDEIERLMIAAVPALCTRLEAARRYHQLARQLSPGEIARDLAATARELVGEALVPLPRFRDPG